MLSQVTMYGDHCSLVRHVELYYKKKRNVKVIHRLDREANGLMIIAHNGYAAGKLSQLFHQRTITKKYWATVHGIVGNIGDNLHYTDTIDNRAASTEIRVDKIDRSGNYSYLEVTIHTGRKHQIRRHLSVNGFPIIGDIIYGGKVHKQGMQLTACLLKFTCPFKNKKRIYRLDNSEKVSIITS